LPIKIRDQKIERRRDRLKITAAGDIRRVDGEVRTEGMKRRRIALFPPRDARVKAEFVCAAGRS
jgi:hypothetical protein